MKLYCPTIKDKLRKYKNIHMWFAWRPVRINDSNRCAWLEYVVRSYPEAGINRYGNDEQLFLGDPKYETINNLEMFKK